MTVSDQLGQTAADGDCQVSAPSVAAVVIDSEYVFAGTYRAIRRIDGATGGIAWEHDATDETWDELSEVAIHPDGRVFVSEAKPDHTELVALDGTSGSIISSWTIGRSHYVVALNDGFGAPYDFYSEAPATSPLIQEDGSVAAIANERVCIVTYPSPGALSAVQRSDEKDLQGP